MTSLGQLELIVRLAWREPKMKLPQPEQMTGVISYNLDLFTRS